VSSSAGLAVSCAPASSDTPASLGFAGDSGYFMTEHLYYHHLLSLLDYFDLYAASGFNLLFVSQFKQPIQCGFYDVFG
jgi:hypothetical protein